MFQKALLVAGLVLAAAGASAQASDSDKEETVTVVGPGFELTGPHLKAMTGRATFRTGKVVFQGDEYRIVTASRYGSVGAVATGEGKKAKQFLFINSSFSSEMYNGAELPGAYAQNYTGCLGASYNAVVIVYNIGDGQVKTPDGRVLDLYNSSDVKKDLFPALISNPANSQWSAATCLTVVPKQ